MAKLLSDYVKVYDGTLSPARCDALIGRFETDAARHERMQAERSYNFAELNVSRHWPEVEAEVLGVMMQAIERYNQEIGIGAAWPDKVWAEKVRMKRYMPGGAEGFAPHVDVMNDEQSRRFLTAILYLNAPGGGETVFPRLDVSVAPAPGRMLVFPPLWLYLHAGLPPRDTPKYILHRYLWYPPASESAHPANRPQPVG
ncbi:MAG: 2OG-Fe(II) oxygenase [Rhizomicrobium sp.]